MSKIIIQWNEISQKEWDRLLKKASRCSFQQSWAYGAIFEHGHLGVDRFVAYDQGEAIAFGQIITRRILHFVRFSLLLKGPVWLNNIDDNQKRQILETLRKKYPLKSLNLFVFSPEEETAPEGSGQNIYKDLGFRQVITGNSTVLIDLNLTADQLWAGLYGKNRTQIRKADKHDFDVIFADHNHLYTNWLLGKERKQQKEKKYQGLPIGLVKGYGEFAPKYKGVSTAFVIERGKREPTAGVLFLRHGRCATYHIGWTGNNGRKTGALNLLLWKMILKLKDEGVETIDLGGLNTEEGADIARYKLSFGGDVVKQNGALM